MSDRSALQFEVNLCVLLHDGVLICHFFSRFFLFVIVRQQILKSTCDTKMFNSASEFGDILTILSDQIVIGEKNVANCLSTTAGIFFPIVFGKCTYTNI